MGGRLALVTGVNEYSGRWAELRHCVHDAEEIAAALEMPEFGFHVTLMRNGQVTKADVFRWLLEARRSGAEMIVFYFAGHGASTEFGASLVCTENREFDEGIPLHELLRVGDRETDMAGQVLFLLDCCHSGATVTRQAAAGFPVRALEQSDVDRVVRQVDPACVVIAACTGVQPAQEATNLGHGVFTYYVLSALMGAAADHTGTVTAHSLYEVVSREMDSRDGHAQTPVFGGRIQGRMVLGNGFAPMLLPQRPEQEYADFEAEAQNHLNQYNRFKSNFDPTAWRSEGYYAACRKLEAVYGWFEKKDKIQGLSGRAVYRLARETLGRYQSELGLVESSTRTRWGTLEGVIGTGGFGKVWKVVKEDGGLLAYKLYHVNDLGDREKVKRFRNGYAAMRQLSHPRIVKVYEYSDCPPGFTMDFIDGSNLRELNPASFMDPSDIFAVLLICAEAIEDAHNHEVIHRDIKPENIICRLDANGVYQPYLTDFDLAWFTTNTQATKTAMGVVYYAAPEQLIAFDPKAVRSRNPTLDVFSFGQLMYYCIVGQNPDPMRIAENCDRLSRKLVQSCSTEVSNAIVELYRRCTMFKPEERIQAFADVRSLVGEIKYSLTHSDLRAPISRNEYLREVSYLITKSLPNVEAPDTLTTLSGQWRINFEWRSDSRRRGVVQLLRMHIEPTERVALQNRPNEKMRNDLNQRVDKTLVRKGVSDRAKRHPGNRGAFTFYLEWEMSRVDRQDARLLCDVLQSVLGSLN